MQERVQITSISIRILHISIFRTNSGVPGQPGGQFYLYHMPSVSNVPLAFDIQSHPPMVCVSGVVTSFGNKGAVLALWKTQRSAGWSGQLSARFLLSATKPIEKYGSPGLSHNLWVIPPILMITFPIFLDFQSPDQSAHLKCLAELKQLHGPESDVLIESHLS